MTHRPGPLSALPSSVDRLMKLVRSVPPHIHPPSRAIPAFRRVLPLGAEARWSWEFCRTRVTYFIERIFADFLRSSATATGCETSELVLYHQLSIHQVGILIGFKSEDDWFDYRLENDPRFAKPIAAARSSQRAGKGVRLEDIDDR